MKLKSYLWMLGIAATLASCSNEDVLQGMGGNDGKTTTLTVTLDDGMTTRAVTETDDDVVDICYLEVFNGETQEGSRYSAQATNSTFSFSVPDLDENTEYTFLFWAQSQSSTAYQIGTTLKEISLVGDLPDIAYSYHETAKPSANMSVTLKHAVAKVTLKTTGTVNTGTSVNVTMPKYTAFDVSAGEVGAVSGNSNGTLTKDFTIESTVTGTSDQPQSLGSFYVLAPDDELLDNVFISHNTSSLELNNVPIKRNHHTILKGDVGNIGIITSSITAEIDPKWNEENRDFPKEGRTIDLDTETLTEDLITEAIADGRTLTLTGAMSDDNAAEQFAVMKAYLEKHPEADLAIDLSKVTGLTNIPDEVFNGCTGLSSVKLSDDITRIGRKAFYQCSNLAEINIPQSLTTLGDDVFSQSGLNIPIVLPDGFTTLEKTDERNASSPFDESKVTAVTLPAGIGDIDELTVRFYGMSELTTITFNSTVKALNDYAFPYCPKLTDIYMLGNATEAPAVFSYQVNTSNVTIHVPQGASSHFSKWAEAGYRVVEVTE